MVNYLHLGNLSAGKTHKNNGWLFCSDVSSHFHAQLLGVALLRFRDKVENNPFGALANWNSTIEGDFGPCSWFGIECSQGHVISLLLSNETAAVSTQNKHN